MNIPHPRPTQLSDPFREFLPSMLRNLLATPDAALKGYQLKQILGPYLPAGTYEEAAYFLPLAFDHLRSAGDGAVDLTTAVIGFVYQNAEALTRDGVLDDCRAALSDCLWHNVRDFTITYFNRDACAAKGWRRPYRNDVPRSDEVFQILVDLEQFKRHADLADAFLTQLADSPNPIPSAWFLELARAQTDAFRPLFRPALTRLLSKTTLLATKRRLVEEQCAATVTASPTYWSDVWHVLEM